MPIARTLLFFLLPVTAATPSLSAQAIVLPQTIAFTGAPAYTQAELLAYTHLSPGGASTQQQLQAAAQHLSDTGLFADVRFASTSRGLTFDLKLMPPEAVLPISFTNFVFWQRPELLAALQTRVPLFHDAVPTGGNLQDALIAALQTMLTERGVSNPTVVATPSAAPSQAPTAIAFAINTPEVLVHAVTVQHSSPAMQTALAPVLAELAGKPYEEAETLPAAATQIAAAYRNAGYLDIAVGNLTQTAPTVAPAAINVDLSATVTEGGVYHLSALTWPGSPVVSAADFEKATKLHPGDVASQEALRQSLGIIARAYFAKGYQDAKVRAPATLDASRHEVAYTLSVVPGDQYRVHSVKTVGLSPEQDKDFAASWHMNQGDFYDSTYMNSFLTTKSTPPSLRGISATWRAVSDPNTRLVDLTLTFRKGGTLIEVH